MSNDSYRVNKRLVRAAFSHAAHQYDELAVLQREIGTRLDDRLGLVRVQPRQILDAGSGTGQVARAVTKRYRGARVVALDISESMLTVSRARSGWWRRPVPVCGDMEYLPFADSAFDMVLSNLTLQWCNEPDRVFTELRRVLRPGGALFFTTFGPDTLKELRASWAAADGCNHVNAFIDMHDVGDAMVRAGLAEPVVDREDMTLMYAGVRQLMRDLKGIGAHNVTAGRPRGLKTPQVLRKVEEAYEVYRRNDGLPATYEVIYGHAWAVQSGPVEVPVNGIR